MNHTNEDIVVVAYDGHAADVKPKTIILSKERLEVIEIIDSWISAGVEYDSEVIHGFVVRCAKGLRFQVIHSDRNGWRAKSIPGPRLVEQKGE